MVHKNLYHCQFNIQVDYDKTELVDLHFDDEFLLLVYWFKDYLKELPHTNIIFSDAKLAVKYADYIVYDFDNYELEDVTTWFGEKPLSFNNFDLWLERFKKL